MFRKISASVDGGLSGGSRMRSPGSDDPIGASGNVVSFFSRFTPLDAIVQVLFRAAYMRCHGTKCPLLMTFFSGLLFSKKELS